MERNIIDFWHTTSYDKTFKDLMDKLKEKYGKNIFDLNGIGKQLDINEMSKQFFSASSTSDVSVDANANVGEKSVISHKIEIAKPMQLVNSYYRLWKEMIKNRGKEYAENIIESQISGRIYVNDFYGFSSSLPYCFNYSAYDTALMGIPDVFDGRGGSKPPKYLMAFLGQIELFSLVAGNSTLGATGLADLLIVISIYMDKILETGSDIHIDLIEEWQSPLEKESHQSNIWQYLESLLTGFIYRLNQPYRGSQSLFSNISVYDDNFIDNLIPTYQLEIDGVIYSAKKDIVKKVQEIYLTIMNNEMTRKPLTFPISTACFSVDDKGNILDKDFLKYISEQNLKFGFINIYIGKSSTLSSCCRLRSEQDNEYFNSFGSGSTKIGSLGVCTGNLPQLANLCKKLKDSEGCHNSLKAIFLDSLKELVVDCQEVNNVKRNIIKRTIKTGSHPMYSLGYMDIKKQYSTFGIVGLYEALEILGYDILTKEGQDFVLEIMQVINDTNKEQQKRFKNPHNCEQIPAENVAVKLAKLDKDLGFNNTYKIYSNQFIPLVNKANLLDRISIQGLFDKHFSGGAICHLNVDQEIKEKDIMSNLIISCAKQGVIYFAINYVIQECEKGHISVGNIEFCPICNNKIINKFTRVVGFLTKVDNWIKERREFDFPNRKLYNQVEI